MHPYFCPITGRDLKARDCKRVGQRLLSPYADVSVQLSGWPLMFIGAGLWFIGSITLTPMAPVLGTAVGASFGIIALLRFARQYRAYRHGRGASR